MMEVITLWKKIELEDREAMDSIFSNSNQLLLSKKICIVSPTNM